MRTQSFWLKVFAIALLMTAGPSQADVEVNRDAALLLRALGYDRNLVARSGDTFTIAILYKPGDAGSEAASKAWLDGFKQLKDNRIQGVPLRFLHAPFRGSATIDDLSKQNGGIDAILLTPGFQEELPALVDYSQTRKTLLLSNDLNHLKEGAVLGLAKVENKNRVVVNRTACRKAGANFSSDLLRLAHLIN